MCEIQNKNILRVTIPQSSLSNTSVEYMCNFGVEFQNPIKFKSIDIAERLATFFACNIDNINLNIILTIMYSR